MPFDIDHWPAGLLPHIVINNDGAMWFDDNARPSDATFIAHDHGRIVSLANYAFRSDQVLHLNIVWTEATQRRCGVAKQLLLLVYDVYRPRRFEADAITDEGLELMNWLRRNVPAKVHCVDAREPAAPPAHLDELPKMLTPESTRRRRGRTS